jgi:hypothetical protein
LNIAVIPVVLPFCVAFALICSGIEAIGCAMILPPRRFYCAELWEGQMQVRRILFSCLFAAASSAAIGQSLTLETFGVSVGMSAAKVDAVMRAADYESSGTGNFYFAKFGLPQRPQTASYQSKRPASKDPMFVPPMPDVLTAAFAPIDGSVMAVHREQRLQEPVHIDTLVASLTAKWGKPTYSYGGMFHWFTVDGAQPTQPHDLSRMSQYCSPDILARGAQIETAASRRVCRSAVTVQVFPGRGSSVTGMHIALANFEVARAQYAQLMELQKRQNQAADEKSKSLPAPRL